jgi:hypothetical protein
MRERHWNALKDVTKKDFVPPYADPDLLLGGILALKLHEYVAFGFHVSCIRIA